MARDRPTCPRRPTYDPRLRRRISKVFPGVQALHDVIARRSIPAQVTALVGENGAGKSTLVKILTGIYQPDERRDPRRRRADALSVRACGR